MAIVEVNVEDAAEAFIEQLERFPNAKPGAEWLGAAIKKTWRRGCNPGGDVGLTELDPSEIPEGTPRDTLMRKDELLRRGLVSDTEPAA